MSSCREVTPLVADVRQAGLAPVPVPLEFGRVQLRLLGARGCQDVRRSFYVFEVVDTARGTVVGDLTFMPEAEVDGPSTLGHVGGGLRPEARGQGLYPEALQAVAPLAHQHGLERVVVSFPPDNHTAIRVADRMGLESIAGAREYVRFAMPLDHTTGRPQLKSNNRG